MAATAIAPHVDRVPVQAPAFEVTVDRDELVKQVAAARAVVTSRVTIPILGNLLIRAQGSALTITASDLDTTVQTACQAKVIQPGACTVPAKKLLDYLKLLPSGEVKITLKENHWIHVRSGRSSTKMVGLPSANFPGIPTVDGESFTIGAEQLLRLVNFSAFAVSEEESRYTMAAALLIVRPTELEMAATDGHRLAQATTKVGTDVDSERRLKIPIKAIGLMKQLFSETVSPVVIAENDQVMHFQCGTRTLITRKVTGNFPNYSAVIPKPADAGVVLDTEYVLPAVERSMLFTEERSGALSLTLTSSLLSIKAAAQDIGQSEEEIDIYGGPDGEQPLRIGFNGTYLREALRLISGAFTLFLTDSSKAGLLEHATEDGYLFRYVIMPMRLG